MTYKTIHVANRNTPPLLPGRELSSAVERLRTFSPEARGSNVTSANPRKLELGQTVWAKTFLGGKGWMAGVIERQLGHRSWMVRVEHLAWCADTPIIYASVQRPWVSKPHSLLSHRHETLGSSTTSFHFLHQSSEITFLFPGLRNRLLCHHRQTPELQGSEKAPETHDHLKDMKTPTGRGKCYAQHYTTAAEAPVSSYLFSDNGLRVPARASAFLHVPRLGLAAIRQPE